jgi:hypothetical protein
VTLPNLFSQLGWLSLLIPILGLALSFKFRARPWAVFVWMPTTLFLAYAALWIVLKLGAFGQVRGPDAIGAGLAYVFLLPALALALLGLVLGFFSRPRRETWRLSTLVPATLICIGLVVLVYTPQGSVLAGKMAVVRLKLTDVKGQPLRGVGVRLVSYERGLGIGGARNVTDSDGGYTLKLRQGQSARLELHHPFPPSGQLSDMPTYWNIGLQLSNGSADTLEVSHSWQRSVGGKTLNEAFRESIPAANPTEISVVLPPHSGLVAPPLREKIHAALLARQSAKPPHGSYEYACRNVEAIEFIPWLIEVYRRDEGSRPSLIEGLSQTASLLAELDRACGALQEVAANPRRQNQNYIDGEFSYETAQMIAWAGVSDQNQIPGLAKARQKIAAHARLLWKFVAEERVHNGGVMKIYGELDQLGRSGLTSIIADLRDHPPATVSEAQQWGPALWRTVPRAARLESFKPLFESDNALLVILACEAMGNQLEADAGPMALKRLEELRPSISNPDTLSRVDMYRGMLRPRNQHQ